MTCDIYSFAIMMYQVLLPTTPLFEEMYPFQFMIAISNNWRPSIPSFSLHFIKTWLKSWQSVSQRILLKDQRQKSYGSNLKKPSLDRNDWIRFVIFLDTQVFLQTYSITYLNLLGVYFHRCCITKFLGKVKFKIAL